MIIEMKTKKRVLSHNEVDQYIPNMNRMMSIFYLALCGVYDPVGFPPDVPGMQMRTTIVQDKTHVKICVDIQDKDGRYVYRRRFQNVDIAETRKRFELHRLNGDRL